MLKIGKIDYTNTLPVFYFFPEERFQGRIEMIPQVPAVLNRAMQRGEVDLGPISSFAYAENQDKYLILPDLSVSAFGSVGSIFLFTKEPLHSRSEMKIALTNTSATSVNLLKILLHHFLKIEAEYHSHNPVLHEMMVHHDGALLIGDEALVSFWKNQGYHVYDLGQLWRDYTGEWMTFALWAVRKEVYEEHPFLLKEIHEAFIQSKQQGRKNLAPIIEASQRRIGGEWEYWQSYFTGLSHDFNSDQQRGLLTYYGLAKEIGLLQDSVKLNLITEWQEN
jgi:chorismate dehydratase